MLSGTGKRKRQPSLPVDEVPSLREPSRRPAAALAINPYSHTPNKLYQFAFAGISQDEEDPTLGIKEFPHRGFGWQAAGPSIDEDTEAETEPSDTRQAQPPRIASAQKVQLQNLISAIQQFLDQGDVEKAAKAFGLALQLRPTSAGPIDIRRYGLWAIGAEIIMREGEEKRRDTKNVTETTDIYQFRIPKRWGASVNMRKLKAYFETLIQQHPYDYKFPNSISAFDFHLAILSCEIYNTHADQIAAIAKLEATNYDIEAADATEGDSEISNDASRQPRLNQNIKNQKDDIRRASLISMREVANTMDGLMREMPYSKSHDYMRLRATLSLYLADLVIPSISDTSDTTNYNEALKLRDTEHQIARDLLQEIVVQGGKLDHVGSEFLSLDPERVPSAASTHIYSTLPIREV